MKAIQVVNPGYNASLKIDDISMPQPASDEILVKVEATALNRADLAQRAGNYPPPEGASEILGLEMAGTVEETGNNVTQWDSGDKVFGLLPGGGYAEYCVIHKNMAIPIPENLSYEEAAAIPETFLTAWQCLMLEGELQKDETVLIHGGGSGVGTAAIQLANHVFDAKIIITAGKKQKLKTCEELGADHVINYHNQDFSKEIIRNLGKNAVDLIIDIVGAPYWQSNIDVLNVDGRLVYLSFLGGSKIDNLSLAPILYKRLKIKGSTLRSRPLDYKIELTHSFWNKAQPLIKDGTMAPVIDSIYDWQDTEEAHHYMKNNQNTGKIVLTGM